MSANKERVKRAVEELNAAVLALGVSDWEVQLAGWGPVTGATSYLRPQGELIVTIIPRRSL